MNFTEAQEQEQKNRKEQMATRYSDAEIKDTIRAGREFEGPDYTGVAFACGVIAQAMLAYNEMIDRRWAGPQYIWK